MIDWLIDWWRVMAHISTGASRLSKACLLHTQIQRPGCEYRVNDFDLMGRMIKGICLHLCDSIMPSHNNDEALMWGCVIQVAHDLHVASQKKEETWSILVVASLLLKSPRGPKGCCKGKKERIYSAKCDVDSWSLMSLTHTHTHRVCIANGVPESQPPSAAVKMMMMPWITAERDCPFRSC